MNELKKEGLLQVLGVMFVRSCADLDQHEPSQYAEPMKENIKQARQQIKEMIQKSEVTEEWIEKKAKELLKWKDANCFAHLKVCKDFIRSLVREIQTGRKK